MLMRKKTFLWLSLLAVFIFMVHSCRNDHFPEKETFNNGSAFQLTSKRISLNQSKHKAVLLPELKKMENELMKNSSSGKNISIGNGLSINTDDVIYIENGPKYYTYTFRIERENAPENAPLENLLLSPLPDGTFKEFLVTYNLTSQEKQELMAGHSINVDNKTTITEIKTGTNWGAQLKSTDVFCYYDTYSEFKPCPCEGHTTLEGCECSVKATNYTYITQVCELYEWDDTITPLDPGGTGGGGGDTGETGGGSNNPPCDPTAPTNPQPGMTDINGCPIGIPTIPNLPNPKTPCDKTKVALANPQVQTKINELKNQAQLPAVNPLGGEKGFKMKTDGTIEDASQTTKHEVDYGDLSNYYAAYHNHTLRGTHMLSHKDIDILLGLTTHNSTVGPGNAFHGMIAAEEDGNGGFTYLNYVVRFNGTYQDAISFNFTDDQLADIKKKYEDAIEYLLKNPLNSSDGGFNLNKDGLQKLFFEAAKLMGMQNNVILQRVDDDGVKTIQLNNDGSTTAVPCP